MEKEVFAFLKVAYQVNNIKISQAESIHTVFVPSASQNPRNCENYYVSHGFGGTALMSFAIIQQLLDRGNVIFWEIRGMGFSCKLEEYPMESVA
jgi:pimeloyl-ACP methyl ester carboxylesterase